MPLQYRYELTTPGELPFDLKYAKDYLKNKDITTDDDILQDMIVAVVQSAERYTGRDLRAKTWKLINDCFEDRTLLRRSQVASITSIQYTLLGTLTAIATSVWYLKKGYQFSEILLKENQSWPTDLDDIEAGIEIVFLTSIPRYIEEYKSGLLRHLAYFYQNRGDCDIDSAIKKSGAFESYNHGRIARI